ncbi:glutamate ABC transporter substrate-binding protein [Demequina sp. SYSU T00039]|uniref:Glutamate ABC transporter substrate-binding protein n=1 Tax=Demequina lignilytica TaxID=3051663 RepID=A0AAW7M1K4_9MICO|nr:MULTISPECIES: glutamate ABC transporter substrate-binding protein [unclassified Demequina]MDN4477171.1 glutamate ABC transporter substrate-binding protein [Demequina sp. SYSU T00039-1]MDN4487344.1 glutamate ABC transporter substrate-binding protein [Demequina sp. SYSU T00039]MDN4491097.1 glutamate ABC transporter substrate-binding protein [Demequina sp. SYSU T00068]
MMRKKAAWAAAAIVAGLTLAACSSGDDSDAEASGDDGSMMEFAEGSTMAALSEAGSITIGTKFDQPLFGLLAPSGDPEGFDVEIGKIIAGKLGIDEGSIEWVETVSANREPFIQDGTVDIVIATYTINDARKELVSFAGPYYNAGQALMTLSTTDDINGPDDLAGKNVCSVEGSTPAQNIADNYPDANLSLFGAYTDCLEPLSNGQVDVVTTDNVILAGYVAESDGEFKVVGEPFTEEPYGIGLALDDTEFRMWINDVLEEIFEDGSWLEAWQATAGTVLPDPDVPTVDRYEN